MTARWRDLKDEERRAAEKREVKARKEEEKALKRGLKDVKKGRVKPWVPGV